MRLCECGCGRQLERRPTEPLSAFERRRFASNPCSFRAQTAKIPPKPCKSCGNLMERKRYGNGVLEDRTNFGRRLYCSPECATEARRKPKSAKTKTKTKRPTASPKPRKAAAKPKQVKVPKPKPAKPPVASQRPVVFTGLPDPRLSASPTIAPALPTNGRPVCPKHPHVTLTSFGCSNCQIETRSQPRNAKPYVITPVWRRT